MRKTNTLKATKTWLNVWHTWATEKKLNLKLEEYENEQLKKMLQIFYTEICTKDGFEYKLESLKSMLAALDHYLKEHNYKYSIIQDREFHCEQGKGKRPNAANPLATEEEEMLWSRQSLGKSSFPNYVVDLHSTFQPEGKTETPFNGSRGLQFFCG